MPYLGNPAQQRFSSPRAASVYSGDGSTVAFTLEEVVSTDEDILVSVDGVIQEPSVAYAVSSGTTLTFTAAPSSNSGNNIFVYYIARTFGSVSMPDGQNVNAAVGTFSGTLDVTGASTLTGTVTANGDMVLGGTTPTLTIGDAGAEDAKIVFDGNAQDFHIGLDDSSDSLTIGLGSALGTTSHMVIDANGHITKPLQPAFQAVKTTTQSNITTGSDVTITLQVEIFDQNADFSSNTFTAPVTGRYLLSTRVRLEDVDTAADYYILKIVTSNRNWINIMNPDFTSDGDFHSQELTVLADMDANDTAYVILNQSGGTAQTDIVGDSSYSYFCGFLAC